MTKRLLIVEDSPTMRQMICMALRRVKDLEIVEAPDGLEGLKRIKSEQFDLILTDINMPMMDGLKLVSLIRQDQDHQDTPIIVVTTESAEADRNRAFTLGANAYVTKPVRSAQLLKKITDLL